jgi:hypothetical protein
VLKFLEDFSISQWSADQLTQALLFIAFVSTIVPFYHGMERHLFETHVARNDINWGHDGRPSNILMDIFAFMFMGALLLSMGRRIDAPTIFFQTWPALLALDIVWSLLVWQYQKGAKPIWAWNNLRWLVFAWILWYGTPWLFGRLAWQVSWMPVVQTGAVAVIEILRSIFDYKIHWHFYFPGERTAGHSLVYLASPYSNDAPGRPQNAASAEKRSARFNAVTEVARRLVENMTIVYSPLTMTHPIDVRMNHDPGSDFWVSFDETFMKHCKEIYVLQLPGWKESSEFKGN